MKNAILPAASTASRARTRSWPGRHVYVGYEFYPAAVPNNEIHLAKSTDHGQTFAAPVKVSDVLPTELRTVAGELPQQRVPQVAIDRSRGSSRGTIYVAWSDGIDNVVQDQPFLFGTYAYPT